MITIQLPDDTDHIIRAVHSIQNGHGLIVIAGADQSWNLYVALKIAGVFRIDIGSEAFGITGIDIDDQYKPEWLTTIAKEDMDDKTVVWVGAIRDAQKGTAVIELAKSYPCIAIMHVGSGLGATPQDVLDRFSDMGCIGAADHITAVLYKESLLKT